MTRSSRSIPTYTSSRFTASRNRCRPLLLCVAVQLAMSSQAAVPTASIDMVQQPLMTERQRDAVVRVMKSADARIEKHFDQFPGLRRRMQQELSEIGAIADPQERLLRANAFRRKHADAYAEVLAVSGVTMEALAGDLRRIFPGMEFRANGVHGLVGTRTLRASATPLPPPPFSEVRNVANDFQAHEHRDCAGKGVATSRFGVRTAISDGSVSGCTARVLSMQSGSGTRDSSLLSGRLHSTAWAIGMLGSSTAASQAALRNVCARQGIGTDRLELQATIAFAPPGWLADVEATTEAVNLQIRNIAPDHACTMATSSYAMSLSVLSPATAGTAEVEVTRALVVDEHE